MPALEDEINAIVRGMFPDVVEFDNLVTREEVLTELQKGIAKDIQDLIDEKFMVSKMASRLLQSNPRMLANKIKRGDLIGVRYKERWYILRDSLREAGHDV